MLRHSPGLGPLIIGTHRLHLKPSPLELEPKTYITENPQWLERIRWPAMTRLLAATPTPATVDYRAPDRRRSTGQDGWIGGHPKPSPLRLQFAGATPARLSHLPLWGNLQLLWGSPLRGRWWPLEPHGQEYRGLDHHSHWGHQRMPEISLEQSLDWLRRKAPPLSRFSRRRVAPGFSAEGKWYQEMEQRYRLRTLLRSRAQRLRRGGRRRLALQPFRPTLPLAALPALANLPPLPYPRPSEPTQPLEGTVARLGGGFRQRYRWLERRYRRRRRRRPALLEGAGLG